MATQTGQHEGVLAKPCGSVEYHRPHTLGDAHGLGDHLPVATAELAPVGSLAFDEVDPHRAGGLGPQLLDLQTLGAQLNGELRVVILQGQAQALRPCLRLARILLGHRLDPDPHALLLHRSHLKKTTWPLMNRPTRPIQAISRYSARAQRARLPCQKFFLSA